MWWPRGEGLAIDISTRFLVLEEDSSLRKFRFLPWLCRTVEQLMWQVVLPQLMQDSHTLLYSNKVIVGFTLQILRDSGCQVLEDL